MRLHSLFLSLLLTGLTTVPAFAYETFTGPLGLLKHDKTKAFTSYTLFTPSLTNKTYLIDMNASAMATPELPVRAACPAPTETTAIKFCSDRMTSTCSPPATSPCSTTGAHGLRDLIRALLS